MMSCVSSSVCSNTLRLASNGSVSSWLNLADCAKTGEFKDGNPKCAYKWPEDSSSRLMKKDSSYYRDYVKVGLASGCALSLCD